MSYHVTFVLNFMVMFFSMKTISWWVMDQDKRPGRINFFLLSPLLSTRPHPSRTHTLFSWALIKFLLALCALTLVIFFSRKFLAPMNWGEIMLISPLMYFLTEALGAIGEMIFGPTGRVYPIHHNPLKSGSVSEFWGRRWNLWVQDWLRDLAQEKKGLRSKLFYSFMFSALFHEMMVNVPWWLKYGESYFGNMMLYFGIQGLGLWIEKKWLKTAPGWFKRLYLWILVITPAPLFINRPFLVFLGIE